MVLSGIQQRAGEEDAAFQARLAALKRKGPWGKQTPRSGDESEEDGAVWRYDSDEAGSGQLSSRSKRSARKLSPAGKPARRRRGSRRNSGRGRRGSGSGTGVAERGTVRRGSRSGKAPRPPQHSSGPEGLTRPHGRKFRRVPTSTRALVGHTQRPTSSLSAPALPDDDDVVYVALVSGSRAATGAWYVVALTCYACRCCRTGLLHSRPAGARTAWVARRTT